jgi:hypothetical protein
MPAEALHPSGEYQYEARISEDAAQQILIAFGIAGPSPEYERWVREDGFRPIDLVDVLGPSPRRILIDWRGTLEDAVADLTRAFASHGVEASFDGAVVADGRRATGVFRLGGHVIEFERTREGIADFRQKLRQLEIATCDALAFRVDDEGTDTIALALLRPEDWAALDALDSRAVTYLFGRTLRDLMAGS